jgi:D-arabinose 1-dehydrogenase-like Zn-dependent alcohol dehydrogenase
MVTLGGQWLWQCRRECEKARVELPVVLGHENAGWVQAVGPQVANLAVGDAVVVHPRMSCAICRLRKGRLHGRGILVPEGAAA